MMKWCIPISCNVPTCIVSMLCDCSVMPLCCRDMSRMFWVLWSWRRLSNSWMLRSLSRLLESLSVTKQSSPNKPMSTELILHSSSCVHWLYNSLLYGFCLHNSRFLVITDLPLDSHMFTSLMTRPAVLPLFLSVHADLKTFLHWETLLKMVFLGHWRFSQDCFVSLEVSKSWCKDWMLQHWCSIVTGQSSFAGTPGTGIVSGWGWATQSRPGQASVCNPDCACAVDTNPSYIHSHFYHGLNTQQNIFVVSL